MCHGSQLTWSLRQSSTAFFPAICCKSWIVHVKNVCRLDKQLQVRGLLNRAKWREGDFWENKGCEVLATHLVEFSRANPGEELAFRDVHHPWIVLQAIHRLAKGIENLNTSNPFNRQKPTLQCWWIGEMISRMKSLTGVGPLWFSTGCFAYNINIFYPRT